MVFEEKRRELLINMARIVVGMSGGVDSSVAAYLLKEQGHEVIGLFMRNWNESSPTLEDECPWIDDSRDAIMVAEQLGIPFQILDLSDIYKERIVDYMFREYAAGRTPNPDVLCNREIKFDVFLKAALKLGAEFVATGHYVQKGEFEMGGKKHYQLLAGLDGNKDQSYFLCQLSQEQLKYALFPLGGMLKPDVRKVAETAGLLTAHKKDSQGLCFIGKISLPDFLQQQLQIKKGMVVEIASDHPKILEYIATCQSNNAEVEKMASPPQFQMSDGKVIGEHNGAHFYTLGQRKGLHIGGTLEALFVLGTDVLENVVYVGQGAEHPGLMAKALKVEEGNMHWVRPDLMLAENTEAQFLMRVRYRQALFNASLQIKNGVCYAKFDDFQKAVTPGQFLAVYEGNELIASGIIS
jgi:tRNA-uridine 2-sulfurtransferase